MDIILYLLSKPERIATPLDELLSRLNLYAGAYKTLANGQKLTVVISKKDLARIPEPSLYSSISFIDVKSSKNNSLNLFRIRDRISKEGLNPKLFVPSDPFRSYLMCLTLKVLFYRKSKLQLQLHGTFSQFRTQGVKSKISTILIFFAIMCSNVIRVVSITEFVKLKSMKFLARKKVILAPIPIYVPDAIPALKKVSSTVEVASLGRIHEERGIRLLTEIIRAAYQAKSNLRFHIVGSGPELATFRNHLAKEIDEGYCIYHGQKSKSEVYIFLQEMDVLINCAPLEGYGLAMRESLIQGTRVVAFQNEGTKTLKEEFPEFVMLFSNVQEAIGELDSLPNGRQMTQDEILRIRKQIIEGNTKNIQAVAASWLC